MTGYELAKEKYAAWGVDTEAAMEQLKKVPVSLHCWQPVSYTHLDVYKRQVMWLR